MYGKPISPHWYFICRSLFQWKHNLSDFMFIYFPHCCEVTVAYLAIFILCQLSGGRKHLYFLRAFSYLTVMMIVLTGSTICGLLSCLTVSVDIMKPSNLWAGLWAEATRGTYKLTSGKYGRGSDCWTICVDSTGVVALWDCDPCRTVIGISGYFCHYDPDNTGTVACCWPQMMSNDFNIFLAASFSDSASAAKV